MIDVDPAGWHWRDAPPTPDELDALACREARDAFSWVAFRVRAPEGAHPLDAPLICGVVILMRRGDAWGMPQAVAGTDARATWREWAPCTVEHGPRAWPSDNAAALRCPFELMVPFSQRPP